MEMFLVILGSLFILYSVGFMIHWSRGRPKLTESFDSAKSKHCEF